MAREGARTALRSTRLRPLASRVGTALSPLGRRLLQRLLDVFLPLEPAVPVEALRDVRRILLVRPNFRLGNALITSPLIAAVRTRFPGATIDYLGGEGTLTVLDGLGVDETIAMSRGFVARPWRFVALFRRLRRRRYDLAIECAMGSFSGGLYAYLSGARHRMGVPRKNERFLDVRLPPTPVAHCYDGPVAFARHLRVECQDRPAYAVEAEEARAASALLAQLDLADARGAKPFVALFIGGHGVKRWPRERWIELARTLQREGGAVLICAGPDEARGLDELRAAVGPGVRVLGPQPLRTFAALLAQASLVVTPDSGPMHLAAAVGAPVVAVLATARSTFFRPRGATDVALVAPSVEEVAAAVLAHSAWPAIARPRSLTEAADA